MSPSSETVLSEQTIEKNTGNKNFIMRCLFSVFSPEAQDSLLKLKFGLFFPFFLKKFSAQSVQANFNYPVSQQIFSLLNDAHKSIH